MLRWVYWKNGYFGLEDENVIYFKAYSYVETEDGERLDTRTDRVFEKKETDGSIFLKYQNSNNLFLSIYLEFCSKGIPRIRCSIGSEQRIIAVKKMIPMVISSTGNEFGKKAAGFWSGLWKKMLLVPYDNTMWLRYEMQPLRAGRKSYEYTILTNPEKQQSMLIGALDFDLWKNGMVCSASDADTLEVISGLSDEGTHDSLPHGIVRGYEVFSSEFLVLPGEDYRKLLEVYGDLLSKKHKRLEWKEGVPFGYNSWAGLAFRLNEENFEKTGNFLEEELVPNGYENQGVSYMNLDAGWNSIQESKLISLVELMHHRGQKTGIYDVPFAYFGTDVKEEIPGILGHHIEEILLKDSNGNLLPRVDGALPYDVTHPLWKEMTKSKYEKFVEWGFDYIKLDFLTHGGMEGAHYDEQTYTGRQAINHGYRYLNELLDPKQINKNIFLSLSIAPIFPGGYGHSRRISCDAFGTAQDVEYELNSHTFGWWMNGKVYQFNDPDHVVLWKSFNMENPSTWNEAKARYTSAIIGGTVLMISDDYENEEARIRAKLLTGNRNINMIAKSRYAFRPQMHYGCSAANVYSAVIEGEEYLAVFHWEKGKKNLVIGIDTEELMQEYEDLWTGKRYVLQKGCLKWKVNGCDALLLKKG